MTDIVKRIDAHLESDNAEQRWLASDNLLEEAQAEIEMLREQIERLREGVRRLMGSSSGSNGNIGCAGGSTCK